MKNDKEKRRERGEKKIARKAVRIQFEFSQRKHKKHEGKMCTPMKM